MHPSVARERTTPHDDGRDVRVAIGPHPLEKLLRIVWIPRGDVVPWVGWESAASVDGHVKIGRDFSHDPEESSLTGTVKFASKLGVTNGAGIRVGCVDDYPRGPGLREEVAQGCGKQTQSGRSHLL